MKKKPTTTQTMTNSPGGIQAGGNVTINQAPQPRHLTTQQQAKFLELLKANPKGEVELWYSISDSEAYNFALEIEDVLKKSGWKVNVDGRHIISPPIVGLKMWVRSAQTAPISATALLNILDAIGLPPIAEQNPILPEGLAVVIVGAMPTAAPSPSNVTSINQSGGITAGNVTVNQGPQPRRLTAEQEIQFVQILKDNPKGQVEITCVESAGPEPCNFARQLAALLQSKDAGWTVHYSPMIFAAGDPTKIIPDMYILVHSRENPPRRAGVLQYALKSVGYDAVGIPRDDVAEDYVELNIGPRNQ